jgi:hypothetical protein
MSFYTNRERSRGCIRAGFVKRVQTQRRRGERMSSFIFTVLAPVVLLRKNEATGASGYELGL